jgi:hypothetical protein
MTKYWKGIEIEIKDVEIVTEDFIDGAVFSASYVATHHEAVIESEDEEGSPESVTVDLVAVSLLAGGATQDLIQYLGGHICDSIEERVEELVNADLQEAKADRGLAA